jgi:ribosomal protein S18 acetylase RimI-like enzyme
MLESLVPTAGYARLHQDGDIVACGLGVVQAGFLGLFDIVVAPHARRRRFGQALMAGLLAWGQQAGAHTAYLQVMLNNDAALRLYSGLGFQEAYQYWYRVKS